MPYAFLLLAVVAFGLLGILHKVADFRKCRAQAINLFLFLGAAVAMSCAGFVLYGARTMTSIPLMAASVALMCGLLASVAILNFQHGVRYGKISTSWLIINLSTALPTILSIVMYREHVGPRRMAGLFLAFVALLILWLERRRDESAEV